MEILMPVIVGILFAAGVFFILQQNIVKLALGLILLTNATNLFIFASGRLTRAVPPLIPAGAEIIEGVFANPVSEALILTAIVIGFGMLSFVLALVYCAFGEFSSLDSDVIGESDE